jgi:hypothetical protein
MDAAENGPRKRKIVKAGALDGCYLNQLRYLGCLGFEK